MMGHCANTGMNHLMAHVITMQGICEMNLRKREAHRFATMSADERACVHTAFQCRPFYYDESRLCIINSKSVRAGMPPPYPYAVPLGVDNGERFLWEYFEQQLAREKTGVAPSGVNERCRCAMCGSNPSPLPFETKNETTLHFFDAQTYDSDEFDDPEFETALANMELPASATVAVTPPKSSDEADQELQTPVRTQDHKRKASINVRFEECPPATKKTRFNEDTAIVSPESIDATTSMFCCHVFSNHVLNNNQRPGRPPHAKDCTNRSTNHRK